jgi:putative transposase
MLYGITVMFISLCILYGITVKRCNKMATQLTQLQADARQERGRAIAQRGSQVTCVEENFYVVKSQSGNGEYVVSKVDGEWVCECPDNKYRNVKCKHIFALEFSQKLREEVKKNVIIQEVTVSTCVFCHSANIKKFGIRKNKSGNIQRFVCADCHKTFSVNIGFERMKHNPQAITSAMQLYFSGESLRNTMESLKLLGVEISHQTVYNWINKYVGLMEKYAETITPNVSDTWRADEIYMKVKGNMKYLFSMMDDETRFWIAQEVAETKDKHDARKLFIQAKQLMKKQPKEFITDGLPTYSVTAMKEFPNATHIRKIGFDRTKHNNNKMERFNGEIRDREKTMRGLKTKDTAILTGYQIFHNYLKPHEALGGKTPAEACGIEVQGNDKWKTLIQNASKNQ